MGLSTPSHGNQLSGMAAENSLMCPTISSVNSPEIGAERGQPNYLAKTLNIVVGIMLGCIMPRALPVEYEGATLTFHCNVWIVDRVIKFNWENRFCPTKKR